MIRGEIKLFIILGWFFFVCVCVCFFFFSLRPLMGAPHLERHAGILMVVSGNAHQHKSPDFLLSSFFSFCLLPQSRRMREQVLRGIHLSVRHCVNTLISHIKQHVQQGF